MKCDLYLIVCDSNDLNRLWYDTKMIRSIFRPANHSIILSRETKFGIFSLFRSMNGTHLDLFAGLSLSFYRIWCQFPFFPIISNHILMNINIFGFQ